MKIKKLIFFAIFFLISSAAFAGDYVIGEGDVLGISVWGEKDLSGQLKVTPDGKITLPSIGEVEAANVTAKELQALLTQKLKKIFNNPIVTVTVTEATNNKCYVFGGGVKSGVFTVSQRTTLLQLLCQIEDVRKADLKKAYLLRGEKKIREDFTNLVINGNTAQDIVIEPRDVIYIPMPTEKNIYVMGAVVIPKFIAYREGITAMEAILEAGGFTKFASPNDTIVYRKEDGKDVTLKIKAKRLMNDGDLTQNVVLKPGDYVFVKEGLF